MNDETIVYRSWPAEVIAEAVGEFNDQMHDGAGIEEIGAGLHGLDFLTRRSKVDDDLQARIDGAITEARMRIDLLSAKEAEERSAAENVSRALQAVTILQKQLASYHHRFICPGYFDADQVRSMVRARVERNKSESP